MKPNTPIIDPTGQPAILITMPIPGRPNQLAILLYPNGRGALVDLALCRPMQQPQQNPPRSNTP